MVFLAPWFWMGGGFESRCVGRVYGADGAMRPYTRPTQRLSVNYLWNKETLFTYVLV